MLQSCQLYTSYILYGPREQGCINEFDGTSFSA